MADDKPVTETAVTAPESPNAGLRQLASSISIGQRGVMPANMAELMDFAQLMAKAGPMVGKSFRGNPGACLGIAMQAMQWGMSPFSVSQKAYVVPDKDGVEQIAYEAQLVNAVINAHAPLKGVLEYIYSGEGADRICTVTGELRRSANPSVYRSPPLKSLAARSPLWKSDPDQQLGYYSSRAWARRYCPEVILGVYTPDEWVEGAARDVTPSPSRQTDIDESGIATTIIAKTSNRAKKDGDDVWIKAQIAEIACPADADALRAHEIWLGAPLAWREAFGDQIDARLEELAFVAHQREHDVTAALAAEAPE